MSPSDVDKFGGCRRDADTVTDVIESQVHSVSEPHRPEPHRSQQHRPEPHRSEPHPLDALQLLAATIDTACEELFAAAPFAGDQATGCSLDAFVDQVVAALRSLQGEADDLRRAMSIAQQRDARRDEGGRS